MDTTQPALSSGWAKQVVENQLTHEQYVTITLTTWSHPDRRSSSG